MAAQQKTIVIVGGGFAGVYTARYLERRLPSDWHIILFSQENHFIFTPLLGDVVGSSINPMHVVAPIRLMARRTVCQTVPLSRIDLAQRLVAYTTADGRPAEQPYDHLVLACGSVVNLDIIPGMAAHGWPLKTMGDALLLRNHLIGLLERAEVEPDQAEKKRLLSVIVVGGGFSGVEVAGEVADLLTASCRFYSTIKASDVRVTLLEGRDRLLAELPPSLSEFTLKKMSRQGIDIRLNSQASWVTDQGVRLKDGVLIEAHTVICTIGTTISPLLATLNLPRLHNRIKTQGDMRVEGMEQVWAVGDCAAIPNAHDNKPAAPTAQMAVREGRTLADNLYAAVTGKPTRPFSYKPVGMLASIGNHKAVGMVFGLRVSGFITWFLWRGIYLGKMPTLARKIQIAFDWAWQLIFPRDIVQLNLSPTTRLGRAHYEAGQFVFHRGDPGERFYVIEKGRAGVYLDESAGPVAILEPGDHFGEGTLLRGGRRSASVKAEEPLDVLALSRGSFAELTRHFAALRGPLERSTQGSRSAAELLKVARDHPTMDATQVRSVMSAPVTTLPMGLNLREALKRSQEGGKGAYPVVDDQGRMVGLLTRTDFYNAWQRMQGPDTPLIEVMRQPVITVKENEPLTAALLTFLREPIKRLVVVSEQDPTKPVGMVTPFDLLNVLAEEKKPVEGRNSLR